VISKIRPLLIGMALLVSCSNNEHMRNNQKIIALAENLGGTNEYFFVGGSGLVSTGIYVRRDENKNNLYTSDGPVFLGGDKKSIELLSMKDDMTVMPSTLEALLKREGEFVIFSPKFIYCLNFKAKRFGKYPRQ
jgi:hypothetical protein